MPDPWVLYLSDNMFISTTDYTFLEDYDYVCLIAIAFPAMDTDLAQSSDTVIKRWLYE